MNLRNKSTMSLVNQLLDPAHEAFDFANNSQLSRDVWADKYRWGEEKNLYDTMERVAKGVFAKDTPELREILEAEALMLMKAGLLMPAGRILAGAGTDKLVTLLNCYVNGTIQDNMKSIMDHVSYAVLTMQQGGGMGTDFSPIRPNGAILKRTGKGSRASGPLPFMDMWNTSGVTVQSAGGRRGAQMGTICDTHPDLPLFIVAKQVPGKLTQFNISVLVSDALMEAVKDDAEWLLYFNVPPITRTPETEAYDFTDDEGVKQYVYSIWQARELWRLITENTYEYSEPGVIFIDRVNELNNLWYCEDIRCTNPCGEQPLPPHNACDLGHVNLARMVKNPFTEDAYFDFGILTQTVTSLTRFLDNVLDVTHFPLPEQEVEVLNKRRIGLGYTGLADALAQLQLRYGGVKSADIAERIMQTICEVAYNTSIDLAIEKGSFPMFDVDKFLSGNSFAATRLPESIKERIREYGIRNGVINTIAPTGTTSCVYGNPSGGLEPFFALQTRRKVLQIDNSHVEYVDYPYAVALWMQIHGHTTLEGITLPGYFVATKNLTIHDHLLIQSRTQRWVDASISKTINIPTEMTYEEFVQVYDMAYASGCKGCTTYRPSKVRGSVLEDATASTGKKSAQSTSDALPIAAMVVGRQLRERPEVLQGATYKIKWPRRSSALYLTINSDEEGTPFEVFITSKDGSASEWTTALSLMITAIFRTAEDIDFIADELMQIQSVNDGAFLNSQFFGSLPAYIGFRIKQHLEKVRESKMWTHETPEKIAADIDTMMDALSKESASPFIMAVQTSMMDTTGTQCPECKVFAMHKSEGCDKCSNCSYSKCG